MIQVFVSNCADVRATNLDTGFGLVGKKVIRLAAMAAGAMVALGVPASAQGPSLTMLSSLAPGRWELRIREAGAVPERICLPDARRLIQLRHPQGTCEQFVVQNSASEITVQYTCRGRGYGRTHIRRETDRLVQIDSQGIADGLPFEFSAEGRRVGDCGA